MRSPLLALTLSLAACATAPTPAGISRDLDRQLQLLSDWPVSTRCQSVDDACDRCKRAGLTPTCWADGWNDQDHDAWIVAVCLPRASRCSAEAHNLSTPGSTPGPATTAGEAP